MRSPTLRPPPLSPAPLPSAVHRALHPQSTIDGFGLIEFLAVAAAGALLAAAAVVMYQRSDAARSVVVEQANVAAIEQNIQRVYAGRNAFGDLTNASALNQGIFPAGMVPARDGFATIANAWGGAVSVAGTTIDGGIPGSGFTIAYSNVPPAACAAFAVAAGNGFDEVTVRQGALSSRDPHAGSVLDRTTRKVAPSLASQRCASGPSTVAFTRATFPLARITCASSGPIPPNADVQTASCPETGTTNALPQLVSDLGPDQYHHTWQQTRSQDGTCGPSGNVVWGPWSPWDPPHTCADQCAPFSGSTTDNRLASCPAGQLVSTPGPYLYQSSWPQTRTITTTQACLTPIGPLGVQQVNIGPWAPVLTCAPACVVPTPSTESRCTSPVQSAPCAPGQIGAHTFRMAEARSATCAAPTGAFVWSQWATTGARCEESDTCSPPGCTWPAAPATAPACPAPYASTPQTGQWVHGATCPAWVWQQTAPCPSCSWSGPPSTTPACPGGGNQEGGTWVHGATCPDWSYSGGTCPPPPAPPLYPYCNGAQRTGCMSTVGPPPMGGPPAQGGVSAVVNDDTNCCHTMASPTDWSIGWSGVAGGSIATGCAASGNGTNNQCMIIGACGDGYTATATVRHLPTNTTRTYAFTYACEVRH